MANLDDYLKIWELSQAQLIAETATSHVYTVQYQQETQILKVLSPLGVADEQQGAIALRVFAGKGAVRLFRADAGAFLMEYAAGDNLIPMLERGEDEAATRIIASVLRNLHQAPSDYLTGLRRLEDWFQALFRHAEQASSDAIFQQGARVAADLLAHPSEQRVLHGDIHHANIQQSTRGWLAFDPKGLYGERTYDAANTLCNPIEIHELVLNEARLLRNAAILAEELALDYQRLLRFTFAYACLSASWSLMDEDDPSLALGVAALLQGHLGD